MKIPHRDFRPKINSYVLEKWKKEWKEEWELKKRNKLYKIKPKLQPREPLRLTRKDCVVFTRLKIGHSHLTHSYILKTKQVPQCEVCKKDFSVEHILTECTKYKNTRKKHYLCTRMKEIFDVVEPHRVLNFIKEIGLFGQI